jgi:G:T-mismatch repair DNA endonuclease (very short patch repair protein)
MKCKKCGKNFEYVNRNVCKVCDFKRRRNKELCALSSDGKWKEKEIDIVLQNLLYEESNCLNDLLLFLDDKTLEDIIDLVSNKIHIGGVSIKIRMNCSYCKSEHYVTISKYLKYKENQGINYCSKECSYASRNLKFENIKKIKLKEDSNIKYIKCPSCGKIFKKEQIGTRSGICLVCSVKDIHEEEYLKLLDVGYWNEEELNYIIYSLKYNRDKTVDKIISELNTNKTLEDIIKLLSEDLKIGDIRKRITVQCETCGKPVIVTFDKYKYSKSKKRKIYCSVECTSVGRTGKYLGENNPKYNKHNCECDYCHKPIKVRNYRYNEKRKGGIPSNHFCSKSCSNKFRSVNYSGKSHPMYGVKLDDDRIEKMREIGANSVKMTPNTLTKPHLKINKLLNSLNIKYTNEYVIKYYSLDIFLDGCSLGIEIMGDYWHYNPTNKYNKTPNKIQSSNITRDKSKHTYTKKYYKFEILYLWENEIINDINLCSLLLEKYIETNGILCDYNSFNYYVNDNGTLQLKENIIHPYFIE